MFVDRDIIDGERKFPSVAADCVKGTLDEMFASAQGGAFKQRDRAASVIECKRGSKIFEQVERVAATLVAMGCDRA